ncbi:MAG: TIGR02444 family protein [Ramlibacter sp.]
MTPRANPFWRFSLRTYREPGVQEACLALQDRCGADVNLLLFCGWTGRDGRVLDEASLRSAVARVGHWQSEVIAPLRLARRGLKRQLGDPAVGELAAPLRKRVLGLELQLERVEQTLLADLAAQWSPPAPRLPAWQAIANNLAAYLQLMGEPAGPAEVANLACIAQACSPRDSEAATQQAQ